MQPNLLCEAAKNARGSSCGWATVEFLSSIAARQALARNCQLLQGRLVFVQLSKSLAQGQQQGEVMASTSSQQAHSISLLDLHAL